MTSDRFSFLMRLTNTTNSVLADVVNFDVSYICKIRTGKRRFPDSQKFLDSCSLYFAEKIADNHVQKTASSILGVPEWPSDPKEAGTLISRWMMSDIYRQEQVNVPSASSSAVHTLSSVVTGQEKISAFYGNSGKREAILRALDSLCSRTGTRDLLFFSDEPLSWLFEDRNFCERCKEYCLRLINSGSRITVISCPENSRTVITEELRIWMPLLLTGRILTYVCDLLQNEISRRTLLISRGELAVSCNSIRVTEYNAISIYFQDKKAADTVAAEFDSYLSISHPLLSSVSDTDPENSLNRNEYLSSTDGNIYFCGPSPAVFSLPERLANSVALRTNCPEFYAAASDISHTFTKLLVNGSQIFEMILLPSAEALMEGGIFLPLQGLLDFHFIYYTPDEYISHLEYVLQLSGQYSNYNFSVVSGTTVNFPENTCILVKENDYAYLSTTRSKGIILRSEEPVFADALQEYINGFSGTAVNRSVNELRIRSFIAEVRKKLDKIRRHSYTVEAYEQFT